MIFISNELGAKTTYFRINRYQIKATNILFIFNDLDANQFIFKLTVTKSR
jgi:hypothetical protein